MKRITRSRFDPNTREEDNNLQEDQLPENGATSSSVEPPNSVAKPPSEQSLTPKIASILDNNVYEVPIKAIPESAEWIFLVVALGLEMLSAAFDQASSPSKPHYALLSMLCAVAALLTTIWELTYKAIKERVVLRRSGLLMLPYFYYPPPRNTVFGDLYDIYGLVGGISQSACSAVQYVYFLWHADNPIKSSLLPAIFLMCLGGSRLNRNRRFSSNVDSNNILLTRELTANRPLLNDSSTSDWSLSVQTEREPSSSLQLFFGKNPSPTVFTASKIADEEKNPLQILVVDDQMVPITNLPYPVKVEIVVLDGDFPTGDDDNWTEEEFENNILRQLTGRRRQLLAGEVRLTVRDGSATIGDVELTESSSWIRSKKFRLGARVIPSPGYQGLRIRAAVTEAFVVKDHRGKHHLPRYLSHTRNNSV
ncbi:unnamed protein product [Malus baccata var. baccata]